MSESTLAAALYAIPALLWLIIAENAWRDYRSRRATRAPLPFALISGLMALHFGLAILSELTPSDLDWQAPGLNVVVQSADTIAIVLALAILSRRGPNWPARVGPLRGRRWIRANNAAAAFVLLVVVGQYLVPAEARWLAWFYASLVMLLYCLLMTTLILRDMRRRMRRGAWRPGGLATPRSMDVVLARVGLALLALAAAVILLSFGLGLSHGARWTLRLLHVGLGLTFAAVPAVRMLGAVVRRLLLTSVAAAGAGAIYFGAHAASTRLTPELARLTDLGAVIALVVLLVPGQRWLGAAIDRVLFGRGRRETDIQAFMHTLAPDLGAAECCRRGLAEIGRVMSLSGAAILLCDGEAAVHGHFDLEPIRRVWPRGGAADGLPARPFAGDELDDARLTEVLREAEVVGVVPLVSPRQLWGHLFVTTGLLGATFIDEDERIVTTFADQLALVLDGADLLARALAVERSLAHAEKLAAIGELAARIAHEIRNPVTAARSLAQQLSREPASPLNAEHAQLILTELERVERQVGALLRFARREEFRFEPVDLGVLVESTVAGLRARLETAGVSVEVATDAGVTARADTEKLRQVLINLIENSLDALADATGSRRLAIAVARQNGSATIRVQDTGPGVSAEALPRLFEPFFSQKATGTGLGLAIVRRTIEAHGGRVEARSPHGAGLTMQVDLPLAESGGHDGPG
jgi:signal transduction histidine kinase